MFTRLEFMAISGPTYDSLPAFQWSTADFEADCHHYGHPDVFKFDPVLFTGTNSTGLNMHRVAGVSVSVSALDMP